MRLLVPVPLASLAELGCEARSLVFSEARPRCSLSKELVPNCRVRVRVEASWSLLPFAVSDLTWWMP